MTEKPNMIQFLSFLAFYLFIVFYNILIFVLIPFLLLLFLLKRKMNFRLIQRFGIIRKKYSAINPSLNSDVKGKTLVHCSSAGEAILAYKFFQKSALYTVFNKDGYDYLKGRGCVVFPLPFDFIPFCLFFLITFKPDKIIFIEQEMWPSFIVASRIKKIPMKIFNGIIYDRSYKSQKNTRFLYGTLFRFMSKIYVQTEQDKQRFLEIGADSAKLEVKGNAKLYFPEPSFHFSDKNEFLRIIKKPLLVFSTIHPEEYSFTLQLINHFQNDFYFIIAPRNIDFLDPFYDYRDKTETIVFASSLISGIIEESKEEKLITSVFEEQKMNGLVLDCFGYLKGIYKYSSLAIIGGSFNGKGAQNFLEPLYYLNICYLGPSYQNFNSVFQDLKDKGIVQVNHEDEVFEHLQNYLTDSGYVKANQTKLLTGAAFIQEQSKEFSHLKINL